MKPHLLYLIGEPGAGKTTLMRSVTRQYIRVPMANDALKRDALFHRNGDLAAIELGTQRGAFSGTDALGMTVIEQAVPYLARHETHTLLAEGARLANTRFLTAAVDAGYVVSLLLLDHPRIAEWRAARAAQLGKEQSAAWVRGARTRAHNLADNPPPGVAVQRGNVESITAYIEECLP